MTIFHALLWGCPNLWARTKFNGFDQQEIPPNPRITTFNTTANLFRTMTPLNASTIFLLKLCIKIPKDMVQTSRAALLSFFSQNLSTILFPIFLKRIFKEWLYCVNQACGSLTHFPLWETMVTENAFLRSSRRQPFRHWEEFRLRLRVLPAASKRGYSYGHQWSFITVFGLWAHMVVCRQFNAPPLVHLGMHLALS